MYEGMSFDELNALNEKRRKPLALPYEQYFGEMDISRTQKERRINTAEALEDVFTDMFSLMFYLYASGGYDYSVASAQAIDRYKSIATSLPALSASMYLIDTHIPETVASVADVVLKDPDNPFNFSIDRARLIAENEANSVWNDAEFEEAVRTGKKYKTWHSILDKRTRDTHVVANGSTKQIMEPFEVGDYLMMFPRDETLGAGPEEIANCRCSVSYK